jgi:hypothetical protein
MPVTSAPICSFSFVIFIAPPPVTDRGILSPLRKTRTPLPIGVTPSKYLNARTAGALFFVLSDDQNGRWHDRAFNECLVENIERRTGRVYVRFGVGAVGISHKARA